MSSISKIDLLWMARFLIGHCHVGAFALPWDTDRGVKCTWFGDAFIGYHLLWDCRGSFEKRRRLLVRVSPESYGNLRHIALHHGSWIFQYLRVASSFIEEEQVRLGQEGLGLSSFGLV